MWQFHRTRRHISCHSIRTERNVGTSCSYRYISTPIRSQARFQFQVYLRNSQNFGRYLVKGQPHEPETSQIISSANSTIKRRVYLNALANISRFVKSFIPVNYGPINLSRDVNNNNNLRQRQWRAIRAAGNTKGASGLARLANMWIGSIVAGGRPRHPLPIISISN